MRFNIGTKMFMILMASFTVLITGLLFFTLFSFETGFTGYVETIEDHNLERLANRLGRLYASERGFAFLEKEPEQAMALEDILFSGSEFYTEESHVGEEDHDDYELEPVFFILDAAGKPVFGSPDPHSVTLPIQVQGREVGRVGVVDFDALATADFIADQTRVIGAIGLAALVISALGAWAATRHFQGPVKRLARTTRELASGNYHARIPVHSRDELGDLTRDVNALAQSLEEGEMARKQWVEDIAHELKTPLTLMGGELEAVRDGIRELGPETLDLLEADLTRLRALARDLTTLWQSECGPQGLDLEPLDMADLLAASLEKFSPEFKARSMDVDAPPPGIMAVDGDARRLGQVFDNLFANCLRYTDSPGRIQIQWEKTEKNIGLWIQDSAPGIPAREYDRIFKRLYRVEPSRNRKLGGTGIGLAICKNIITAHGGTIVASASPLGGLSIHLELPIT
ncbi:MAG: ATP-binding protein [Desulfobacterales bacterium]|nr:ATP-binding protein [Desulfobacterales bacterium]